MKHFFTSIIILILSLGVVKAQELETPAASPLGTVMQIVGLTEVSVTYSRPGIKGRQIFGGLVPYDKLWRTGANMATKISFSDDVTLEGRKVPAGEYALFTIPGKEDWTIIISPNLGPGISKYNQEEDVARFMVTPQMLDTPVERFTIDVRDMTNSSARIVLSWEKTLVAIKMTVDTDTKVMTQIRQVMQDPNLKDANIYFSAAQYYYSTGKDLNQALSWINSAIELKPEAFWMSRVKSQIQAKQGDYAGAIATAKMSMEAAEKAGSETYVKFNKEAIAEWQQKK